eukprot:Gregarina_sp_Pseudo_9__3536@NODE_369_length_3023_cov_18_979893_g348_i0_p3_GENE_NODE_369_length_3023_cov_18_979893_g348_i0NODE_369_length_3023_cov_18_979893_g348_i0_p3_ORF_typecomplete_len129_score27_99Defensin_propep/PF00879_18/13Defensin_propep/PF00879_18/1e02_NODE_369_length_3023_cov_18_979893_g348_i022322618
MTYLRDNWDDASRRRLGVLLTLICAALTVLSFLAVAAQAYTGNADRVARAYFQWLKLYEIQLNPKERGRRWTLAEMQDIEKKLNINARAPPRPPTEEEAARIEKQSEWRADDAVALAIRNYEARGTVG